MAGVTGVAAVAGALKNAELAAQYQAKTVSMQVSAMRDQGTAALKLIEAAMQAVDPNVGGQLNITG